jgi:hypothetical protein
MRRTTLLTIIAILFAIPASAQFVSLIPTSKLAFTASPEHSTVFSDGTPVLVKYVATYCQKTAPTTCVQVDLGKPTPDATSTITIPNFFGTLTPNIEWTVSVVAVGSGASSNPAAAPGSFAFGKPSTPQNVVVVK